MGTCECRGVCKVECQDGVFALGCKKQSPRRHASQVRVQQVLEEELQVGSTSLDDSWFDHIDSGLGRQPLDHVHVSWKSHHQLSKKGRFQPLERLCGQLIGRSQVFC